MKWNIKTLAHLGSHHHYCFRYDDLPPPQPATEEVQKTSLFKRKGVAIGKLSALSFGSKATREEAAREREEKEQSAEAFRKVLSQIIQPI